LKWFTLGRSKSKRKFVQSRHLTVINITSLNASWGIQPMVCRMVEGYSIIEIPAGERDNSISLTIIS
jgi:hypothetical protein